MSTPVDLKKILEPAYEKITTEYELGDDFIKSFQNSLESVLKKYYIYDTPQDTSLQESGSKKDAKPKTPRAKSAYNFFVKMNTKDYAHLKNQKERMTALGAAWKNIKPEDKVVYLKLAAEDKAALQEKLGTDDVVTETVKEE